MLGVTSPTDAERVLAARLAAQRLSGPPAAGPLEVTRHLLAVQAQDARAARLAIRARSADGHSSDVDRALSTERSLIITWVNRGTLHLLAAEDEAWLRALTTPQLRTANDRRLHQEGVGQTAAERGVTAITTALGDAGPLTRAELRTALDHADVPTAGQALVHLLMRATLDGLILRGPIIDGEHAFVLATDWLGPRPTVERAPALAELARRYLTAHSPADDRDLAKWAGLSLRDARAGLQAIAHQLHERPDGLLELDRDPPPPIPPPRLLGPFDPLLLGWRSRNFIVQDAQEVITSNGMFRAIVLIAGRAAGTWTLPRGHVQLNLWHPADPACAAALQAEAAAVEHYLAPPA